MSIFYCVGCDELRDADDGCDEAAPGSLDLICVECMEAREEAEESVSETPPQQDEPTSRVGRSAEPRRSGHQCPNQIPTQDVEKPSHG